METLFSCTYNWEMLHQQLLWGQGGDHFSPVLVGASETDQAGGRRQDLPVGPMGRELLVPTHQLACPVLDPVLSVRSNPEGRMGKGGDGEGRRTGCVFTAQRQRNPQLWEVGMILYISRVCRVASCISAFKENCLTQYVCYI